MSKKTEFFNQIDVMVENKTRVILFFNSTSKVPVIGKFVYLDDFNSLRDKDFARFVTDGMEDSFVHATDYYRSSKTKIMKVSDFLLIKPVICI